MLKILSWRALYHFYCLCKRLGFRGKTVFYFAYGGNLSSQVLTQRRMQISSQQEFALPNYKLSFCHEIPFENAAMASILPAQGEFAYGMLFEISKIDQLRMDYFEGFIFIKRYKKVFLKSEGGLSFYFYQSNRVNMNRWPPKAHVDKILSGYETISLVTEKYKNELRNISTVPELKPSIPPYFLIRKYPHSSSRIYPFLVKYDLLCAKLYVHWLRKLSIFEG